MRQSRSYRWGSPETYGLFTVCLGASYAVPPDSGTMEKLSGRPTELALASLVLVTLVVLLAAMPSWAAAGLAVAAAASWCLWLERHPTS